MRIRNMSRSTRTRWVIGAMAALVTLGSAGSIAAAVTPDTEPSYTGCLRTSGDSAGRTYAIAPGSSPLRACASNEQQFRISGGDVTSVNAGTGLRMTSGGGLGITDDQGNTTVDLGPGYRLPQGCKSGDTVSKSAGSTWECSTPKVLPAAMMSQQIAPNGSAIVGNTWSYLGKTIPLAPGKYTFVATVNIVKVTPSDTGMVVAECRVDVGSQTYLAYANSEVGDWGYDGDGRLSISLSGAVDNAAGAKLGVACEDGNVDMLWRSVQVTATPVSSIVFNP